MKLHGSINRLLEGFDTILTGVRIIVNVSSPQEVSRDIDALRRQTLEAFRKKEQFDTDVATVLKDIEMRLTHGVGRDSTPDASTPLGQSYERVFGILEKPAKP